ncbi:TPA: Lrp/AsnC family transcriptional regulator [Candidatus Woesearchaeota archaeon]|nr:Lrp/AsnC family transcriptional regulator [Candidatus Woesearchaeota archaeon]
MRRLQKESGDVSHPGIDGRDLALVEALKQNAKASLAQLSALTGMPRNTVHNRIKRLERSGVIQSYTARVDYKKLGQSITAFVLLDIDYGVHYDLVEKLRVMPFVHRIFSITGRNDLVLMIRARNPDELARFVLKEIRIRGVSKTETLLVLEELK